MKQIQYTETQKVVLDIIDRLFRYVKDVGKNEIDQNGQIDYSQPTTNNWIYLEIMMNKND